MVIDIIIVIIFIVFFIHGYLAGLIRSIFNIGGIIAGYLLALGFAPSLHMPKYLAFLLIFVVTVVIFSVVGRFVSRAVKKTPIGNVDRLTGGFLGLLKAFIVCFVLLLAAFLLQRDNRIVQKSRLAPEILNAGMSYSSILPGKWYQWLKKVTGREKAIIIINGNNSLSL